MDEMMATWMKYAQPTDKHKFLERLAGKWNAQTKIWMQPDAPPMESTGVCENTMMMGGRYLQCAYSGEMMGQRFEGQAIDGYDNYNERYRGIWIDNMGTAMMVFEGQADDEGNVRTMNCKFNDMMTGQQTEMKSVTTIVSESEHRYESWRIAPDGSSFRNMEIIYTRA